MAKKKLIPFGLDLGYGRTKSVALIDNELKYKRSQTLLAYFDSKGSDDVRGRVVYDGKEYVVGEDALYFPSKINIASMDELVNYYNVFIKATLDSFGLKPNEVYMVTGLPPAMYASYRDKVQKVFDNMGIRASVEAQTTGIFVDCINMLKGDVVLIIDPGYRTLDYLLMKREDETWRRIRSGTLDSQGINKAVELMKNLISDEKIKNQPTNVLQDAFEKGRVLIGGEPEDLTDIKAKAVEQYIEVITGRLKAELSDDLMSVVEQVIIGGGGAYYINPDVLGFKSAYKPEKPEFSQARGYLKFAQAIIESEN